MLEPPIPPVPCPFGGAGWPMACQRVELTMAGAHTLHAAAYTVALVARQLRLGVVATYNGRDLYAFPHQTTDEIERTYMRETLLAAGAAVAAKAVSQAGAVA